MIRFYKHRYIYFTISICLILAGFIAAWVNGIKLDTQFKGGTIFKYTYAGTIDEVQAGNAVELTLGRPTNAQLQSNIGSQEQMLILSLADNEALTSQDQEAVSAVLNQTFPDAHLTLAESLTVEPFLGARFFQNGMIAIALSFLLVLVYVGFRFKKMGGVSAGTMAIIALIHDCLMVTVAFIVFKIPLNDSFIAAILTIIGFSINDTIVIYDRIRENKRLYGTKISLEELVDKSINQSVMRSVNTNMSVLVSITVVYVFALLYGIESIRAFALPMIFGTISGCYSTVCIAGPLWTMWQNHKKSASPVRA